MVALVELARPKVNLTLRVLGRRSDGYHELESLVAFADGAADVITLTPGAEPSLTVSGPFASEIAGVNLISTTLRAMPLAEPRLKLGAIHLEKNLPVASGIGGGSADAAGVMRAVLRANPDVQSATDWMVVARWIGADVPVCLLNSAALMRGTGERLEPVQQMTPLPAVLANPMVPVPAGKTAEVFKRLAAGPVPQTGMPTRNLPFPASTAELVTMIENDANDLEGPASAIVPEIGEVLAALRGEARCRFAHLSGAGPTCFGVFETWRAADAAASRLSQAHPAWWVQPVVLG